MFGKKKPERPKRQHSGNLSQYGLFDVPTNLSFENDGGELDDGGDSDLEAELLALTNDNGAKPKHPVRKKPNPTANLDAMVQESMKDIPSDAEDDESGDDDPDLLNELNDITGDIAEAPAESPVKEVGVTDINKLLEERLKMYEAAENNAKLGGETGRARRFSRGIKTIKEQIKATHAGKLINNDDIPPEVTVNIQKRDPVDDGIQPIRAAPPPPPPTVEETPAVVETPNEEEVIVPEISPENRELLIMLNERRNQYKSAALDAKKAGDTTTAMTHIKIVKQFEAVIKAVEIGQAVDISRMPGPPFADTTKIEESEAQTHSEEVVEEVQTELITANSVAEALQQRLDVYKAQEDAAKEQANTSKARRMGRIVKQFEQAIKLNNAGKPVPLEDLPTPPGYAPIPGTIKPPPSPPPAQAITTPSPTVVKPAPMPPPRSGGSRTSGNHVPTSRMEKQLEMLTMRQREFKEAALNAKKKGEIEQAKEFLRTAKGFDPLIEAAEGGLPVDVTSLPIPPSAKSQLDTEYDLVMADECTEDDNGVLDVISRLEAQLTKQLKMCLSTRDHHKALGDVAGTNRFEHLALSVTKDLDLVRLSKRTNGAAIPKFHYETRDFSIVKSFTDLNDNDLELTVVRGINYNCANPKEIDTFVKFEFPYPQEEPLKDKTVTIKDTNNPEYNSTFTIPIQRTARPCLRVFKRHAVKFEVYSRGGFFRGDTLMGTINIKLQPLETQCELHESFDLMDGRKKVGGKLEVKLRVRHPLLSRQVEQLSERWLVVDR